MQKLWRVESPALDAAGQMVADEGLARRGMPDGGAGIRFFRWQDGAALTFGYAQRRAAVEQTRPADVPATAVVRRPTGGGVVMHRDDVTFSCVFPVSAPWRPAQIYRALHLAFLKSLGGTRGGFGICAQETGGSGAPERPGGAPLRCFADAPVAMDLLDAGGRKILGGALRNFGGIALYQGTLQLPGARGRAAELEAAILDGMARFWGAGQIEGMPLPPQDATLEAKYRSTAWNFRR